MGKLSDVFVHSWNLSSAQIKSLHSDPDQFLEEVRKLRDYTPLFTTAESGSDVFFQNTLHKIESGMVAQTASSLNGVLIT